MRLTIPQPQLLRTLQMVEHVVNDRSTLPILANVLLEASPTELTLTATDLDVGIRCRFPLAPPVEQGAVTLPARKLTTIVRELAEEAVTLEARKNHTAVLNCGASTFRIPGLPAEDFPTLPDQRAADRLTIPQAVLKALISKTAYAMSIEETRFILNGALLTTQMPAPIGKPKGGQQDLVLVATDGRRLAIAHGPLSGAPRTPFTAVIPAKTIRELGRLLESEDPEEMTIAPLQENQVAFSFGPVMVVTRLIEGQFPAFDKVIPAPAKRAFSCNREGLLNAVRRASLMTTATSQAVVFELERNRLVVSKESAELGSAREELPVEYDGEPVSAAFNPEFWLDLAKALEA